MKLIGSQWTRAWRCCEAALFSTRAQGCNLPPIPSHPSLAHAQAAYIVSLAATGVASISSSLRWLFINDRTLVRCIRGRSATGALEGLAVAELVELSLCQERASRTDRSLCDWLADGHEVLRLLSPQVCCVNAIARMCSSSKAIGASVLRRSAKMRGSTCASFAEVSAL